MLKTMSIYVTGFSGAEVTGQSRYNADSGLIYSPNLINHIHPRKPKKNMPQPGNSENNKGKSTMYREDPQDLLQSKRERPCKTSVAVLFTCVAGVAPQGDHCWPGTTVYVHLHRFLSLIQIDLHLASKRQKKRG
jgi:hypothetical protein